MICVDALFEIGEEHPLHHVSKKWCHIISDIPGPQGTMELKSMAVSIGLQERWIQDPGTTKEHFDLVPNKRRRALSLGAKEITREEFVRIKGLKVEYQRRLDNNIG